MKQQKYEESLKVLDNLFFYCELKFHSTLEYSFSNRLLILYYL